MIKSKIFFFYVVWYVKIKQKLRRKKLERKKV